MPEPALTPPQTGPIAVIVGSKSDCELVRESKMFEVFKAVGVDATLSIVSAHRNADDLEKHCDSLADNGAEVFIAAAGLSAALPAAIAAILKFEFPVIGVPLPGGILNGLDAVMSILQMPQGVPVAVVGSVGKAGLYNAALIACQMLAMSNTDRADRLANHLRALSEAKPPKLRIGLDD